MSSSDFGLGTDSSMDYVEIHWPSGISQGIDRPEVGPFLSVGEPAK
jgi:hypothetical protein